MNLLKCIFLLLFMSFQFMAYSANEHWSNVLVGPEIENSDVLEIEDSYKSEIISGASEDIFDLKNSTISLALSFDQTKFNYFPSDWSLKIEYEIGLIGTNGAVTSTLGELEINYAVEGPYKDIEIDLFDDENNNYIGAYLISKNIVETVGISEVPSDVFLELSIDTERYYKFIDDGNASTPIVDFTEVVLDAQKNYLEVSWNYTRGAEFYDVEWLYVDFDFDIYDGEEGQYPVDFKNATRVRTTDLNYVISCGYPKGVILCRVRGVGFNVVGENLVEKQTEWSLLQSVGGNLSNFIDTESYYVKYNGLSTNENWTFSSNFAENGFKVDALSYADNALNPLQSITYSPEDNTAIISTSLLDYHGRPTINMMPSPSVSKGLGYYENILKHTPTGENYDFTHFDRNGEGIANTLHHPDSLEQILESDNTGGPGFYYSSDNVNTALSDFENGEFIPNAEGYPFARTIIKPDGSGRVKEQRGLGKELADPNRSTKFLYGGTNEYELYRLFGNEAGEQTKYRKTYTVDPNGQTSVAYTDLQGRVIASGLAGSTPDNLTSLDDPYGKIKLDTVNANLSPLNIPDGNTIDMTWPISVPESRTYTFDYGLGTINDITDVCFENDLTCEFEFYLALYNEYGDLVVNSSSQPIEISGTFTAAELTNCNLNCDFCSQDCSFIVTLTPGDYRLVKTVRLAEANITDLLYDTYGQATLSEECLPFIGPEMCEADLCLFCENYKAYQETEGSEDFYWILDENIEMGEVIQLYNNDEFLNLLDTAGYVVYPYEANNSVISSLITQCETECATLAIEEDECEENRQSLIRDMSPGGQYFDGRPVYEDIDGSANNGEYDWVLVENDVMNANFQWLHDSYLNNSFNDRNVVNDIMYYVGLAGITLTYSDYSDYQYPAEFWSEISENWDVIKNSISETPTFYAPSNGQTIVNQDFIDEFLYSKDWINHHPEYFNYVLTCRTHKNETGTPHVISFYDHLGIHFSMGSGTAPWNDYLNNFFYLEGTEFTSVSLSELFNEPEIVKGRLEDADIEGVAKAADYLNIFNRIYITSASDTAGLVYYPDSEIQNSLTAELLHESILSLIRGYMRHANFKDLSLLDNGIEVLLEQAVSNNFGGIPYNHQFEDDNIPCSYGYEVRIPESHMFEQIYNYEYNGTSIRCVRNISNDYDGVPDCSIDFSVAPYNAIITFGAEFEFTDESGSGSEPHINDPGVIVLFSQALEELSDPFNLEGGIAQEFLQGPPPNFEEIQNANELNVACACESLRGLIETDPNYDTSIPNITPSIYVDFLITNAGSTAPSIESLINSIVTLYATDDEIPNHGTAQLNEDFLEYYIKPWLETCSQIDLDLINGANDLPATYESIWNTYSTLDNEDFDLFPLGLNCLASPLPPAGIDAVCSCEFLDEVIVQTLAQNEVNSLGDLDAAAQVELEDLISEMYSSDQEDGGSISYPLAPDIEDWYFNCHSFGVENIDYDALPNSEVDSVGYATAIVVLEAVVLDDVIGITGKTFPDGLSCAVLYPDEPITIDLCNEEQNLIAAELEHQEAADSIAQLLLHEYSTECIDNYMSSESLWASYELDEYAYTLYYYDQAGNLIKTIPPEGVYPMDSLEIEGARNYSSGASSAMIRPEHKLITNYQYNSYNQLIQQSTPDGGMSYFWYDTEGRIVASQNAKQINEDYYSYTLYDQLGRPYEVGEVVRDEAPTELSNGSHIVSNIDTWLNTYNGNNDVVPVRREVTKTFYEKPINQFEGFELVDLSSAFGSNGQLNLRNRVSSTIHYDWQGTGFLSNQQHNYSSASHYSYDIHGNVKVLVQDNRESVTADQRLKKIEYEYDLISGNVKQVSYQAGEWDQFYQKYEYDKNNRLKRSYSSDNGYKWELESKQFYAMHGPMTRVELGDKQVQACDYAYTINGWLKGANSSTIEAQRDMGKDGWADFNNPHNQFGKDVFGFSLDYFDDDYKSVSEANINYQDYFLPVSDGVAHDHRVNLFNGNIGRMVYTHTNPDNGSSHLNQELNAVLFNYDQLNRIKSSNVYRAAISDVAPGGAFENSLSSALNNEAYATQYEFDQNGNLVSLNRNANKENQLEMDDLLYHYNTEIRNIYGEEVEVLLNNKLNHVDDEVLSNSYAMDIDDQGDPLIADGNGGLVTNYNYEYDEIGQLLKDKAEGIEEIEWTVSNKVRKITRKTGFYHEQSQEDGSVINVYPPGLEFRYDPFGNRIEKIEKPRSINGTSELWNSTIYVRDTQGNVLSTYSRKVHEDPVNAAPFLFHNRITQEENHIYGGKRLGIKNEQGRYIEGPYRPEEECDPTVSNCDGVRIGDYIYGEVPNTTSYDRTLGLKGYELTDHRSNVYNVVSDRKLEIDGGNSTALGYESEILSATDYYPYGMTMPGRSYTNGDSYRYGFQGQEGDDELKGTGNSWNYKYRMHDARIGRFFAVDPLAPQYPHNSPYAFSENSVIRFVELEGLEKGDLFVKEFVDELGNTQIKILHFEDYGDDTVNRYFVLDENGETGFENRFEYDGQYFEQQPFASTLYGEEDLGTGVFGRVQAEKDGQQFIWNSFDVTDDNWAIRLAKQNLEDGSLDDLSSLLGRRKIITSPKRSDFEKLYGKSGNKKESPSFDKNGKLKNGPEFSDLKDHAKRHNEFGNGDANKYYNSAVYHQGTSKFSVKVRHNGQTKINHITPLGSGKYAFTSTSKNGKRIYTHMQVDLKYLSNKGITLPKTTKTE